MEIKCPGGDRTHDSAPYAPLTPLSANTSGSDLLMKTDKPSATRAAKKTILGLSIADISSLGGIWPPDGTKTTAEYNAPPATSSARASSTDSGVDWILRTKAWLTECYGSPSGSGHTRLPSSNNSPVCTESAVQSTSSGQRPWLTPQDVERVAYLRKARRKAMAANRFRAARAYSLELYELTHHHGYYFG